MALKPPRHRITSAVEFVYQEDTSWKIDLIEREIREEKEAALKEARPVVVHPFARYVSGETRFDLNAELEKPGGGTCKVPEYFEGEPTIFTLRKVPPSLFQNYKAIIERAEDRGEFPRVAFREICTFVVESVRNGPSLEGVGKVLSDRDMDLLHAYDPDLSVAIGRAAWIASQPLTDSEKKP